MSVIDAVATGAKIRKFRIDANMTIKQVQDACGVTSTSVCNWQNGKSIPSIDNLVILAALWHTTIDDMVVTISM